MRQYWVCNETEKAKGNYWFCGNFNSREEAEVKAREYAEETGDEFSVIG